MIYQGVGKCKDILNGIAWGSSLKRRKKQKNAFHRRFILLSVPAAGRLPQSLRERSRIVARSPRVVMLPREGDKAPAGGEHLIRPSVRTGAPVSLRLGRATRGKERRTLPARRDALGCPRHVIHSRGAASLPRGRGKGAAGGNKWGVFISAFCSLPQALCSLLRRLPRGPARGPDCCCRRCRGSRGR